MELQSKRCSKRIQKQRPAEKKQVLPKSQTSGPPLRENKKGHSRRKPRASLSDAIPSNLKPQHPFSRDTRLFLSVPKLKNIAKQKTENFSKSPTSHALPHYNTNVSNLIFLTFF